MLLVIRNKTEKGDTGAVTWSKVLDRQAQMGRCFDVERYAVMQTNRLTGRQTRQTDR